MSPKNGGYRARGPPIGCEPSRVIEPNRGFAGGYVGAAAPPWCFLPRICFAQSINRPRSMAASYRSPYRGVHLHHTALISMSARLCGARG